MSEPRKLYTGSASGGLDQEQYEAARRRAHPKHIVIAPLDINRMIGHHLVHDDMRPRTSVIDITHDMKMIDRQALNQLT